MARTGTFGRQPKPAMSLQATLLAIARELQNQRDQNLMQAWQKGGMFEGQKATDALVLAHWRERLDGISKDDPLYDTYKNAVTQIEYSIAESKMTAAYALGKKTDAQMVKFFLDWSKKVPKDSEFYRVLQRDAGQYMRVQRANSEAARRRAEEKRYQDAQNATFDGKEAAGDYIIGVLRRVAQSGYADGGIAAVISAPGSGSDLTDFDPTDPETMLRLLNAITPRHDTSGPGRRPGSEVVGNTDVIYHDDSGNGVTGQAILDQLAKFDPSYRPGQPLDVGYITSLLNTQIAGIDERIQRARETGHMSDVVELEKSKRYVATLNREVAAWPIQKAYADLRSTFDAVRGDPSASPAAVLKAWQQYRSDLIALSDDPRIAADDNLRSRILGEANGSDGQPTLAESFTGLQQGAFDPSSAKDAGDIKAHMEFLQEQVDAVAKGAAYWTYGSTGKDGVFVPGAGGVEIGAAPYEAIRAGGKNEQLITVDDPQGGAPLSMIVTAVPVFATAKNSLGEKLSPENLNPIAYAYDIQRGGKMVTIYGFQTKDGFVFSDDPPWDERLRVSAVSSGGNHLEVDLTPVVPQDADLKKNADLGGGWHVQGATLGRTGVNPGALTFDPLGAATSTSTRSATGGNDPTSDFHSLTLALLQSSPEGQAILSQIDKNPSFKTQLTNDAMAYAGATWDPAAGAWVPGTGDPNKLSQANQQINALQSAKGMLDFVGQAAQWWQRVTTGTPFTGGTQPKAAGEGFDLKQLATDLLQGTPFESLGKVFQPGTNMIRPPEPEVTGMLQIKTQGTIKAPTFPEVKPITLTTGPTAGPTSFSTTPQQTTQAPIQTTQSPYSTTKATQLEKLL